jgi:3-hydroxyacyl-[acyl-carrier-protein] dehydratase
MRWIWIDRILELERGRRCVAVKNVSAAEEVLHDHFPAAEGRAAEPVLPNPLIIEGMAQTAGIMVGHAGDFKEKVILAKITKAEFSAAARPGYTIRYTAEMDSFSPQGASTHGTCELIDPHTGDTTPLAEIVLMFSHIDRNISGLEFPEHNFVFTGQLMEMLSVSGFSPLGD